MCDYTGNDFGAPYNDACCIDGFLWDLDSCDEPGGGLSVGGDIPCPQCNHKNWLEYYEEDVINDGYNGFIDGKPETGYPKARFDQDQEKIKCWWEQGWNEAKEAYVRSGVDPDRFTVSLSTVVVSEEEE